MPPPLPRGSCALALALIATAVFAATDGDVRLAGRTVLRVGAAAGVDATSRASLASAALEQALADPACDPESVGARAADTAIDIVLCGRTVLSVAPEDAERLGTSREQVAEAWAKTLTEALDREKRSLYGTRLLRRAIAGLAIPVGFVVVIALVRRLFLALDRRLRHPPDWFRGLGAGPFRILASPAERRVAAIVLVLVRFAAYAIVAYAFLIALFRQLPATEDVAGRMLGPVANLGTSLLTGLVLLLPRLAVVAVVFGLLHVALKGIGRLFDQVRRGEIRLEPVLSAETATPVEQTARIAVVVAGLVVVSLVLPGLGGLPLQVLLIVAALALALGARDLGADVLGGLLIVYGRPFHTGQRIRVSGWTGTVERKGLVHTRLRAAGSGPVLLPNRLVVAEPVTLIEPVRAVAGTVLVDAPRGRESGAALIRSAASAVGLRHDEEIIRLAAVRDGALLFDVRWPLPSGGDAEALAAAFVGALVERAGPLEVRVRDAALSPDPVP